MTLSVERSKLISELDSWIGTPFFANQKGVAVKGVSADCVSFILQVFKNLGVISVDYFPQPYLSFHPGAEALKRLYNTFDELGAIDVTDQPLQYGDVLVCSSGRAVHHTLIYAGELYHCYPPEVGKMDVNDHFIKRTHKRTYRFYQ